MSLRNKLMVLILNREKTLLICFKFI